MADEANHEITARMRRLLDAAGHNAERAGNRCNTVAIYCGGDILGVPRSQCDPLEDGEGGRRRDRDDSEDRSDDTNYVSIRVQPLEWIRIPRSPEAPYSAWPVCLEALLKEAQGHMLDRHPRHEEHFVRPDDLKRYVPSRDRSRGRTLGR